MSKKEFNRVFAIVAEKLIAEGKIEVVSGKGANTVYRKIESAWPKESEVKSFSV